MNEEVQTLEDNYIWQIVNPPSNAKVMDGKWVYKIKHRVDNTPSRYKARWVVKGYEQIYSINFKERYVVVIKVPTYQILFAFIAYFFWHTVLMNAVTAFLNSEIDVTIYKQFPAGYYGNSSKIALLLKPLYGLKQSARQWASLLGIALKKASLKSLYSDFSVYVCHSGTVKIVIVATYVNNILITGPDIKKINALKKWLLNCFQMKDLGSCYHYLGMKVDCDLEAKTLYYFPIRLRPKGLRIYRDARLQKCSYPYSQKSEPCC